jgi:hypothetical protein
MPCAGAGRWRATCTALALSRSRAPFLVFIVCVQRPVGGGGSRRVGKGDETRRGHFACGSVAHGSSGLCVWIVVCVI